MDRQNGGGGACVTHEIAICHVYVSRSKSHQIYFRHSDQLCCGCLSDLFTNANDLKNDAPPFEAANFFYLFFDLRD